jgi:hypothetical protein
MGVKLSLSRISPKWSFQRLLKSPGLVKSGQADPTRCLPRRHPVCHPGSGRLKYARRPGFRLSKTGARRASGSIFGRQNRHPRAPLRGACGVLDPGRPA